MKEIQYFYHFLSIINKFIDILLEIVLFKVYIIFPVTSYESNVYIKNKYFVIVHKYE